jgi:hypothetical protein
VDAGGTVKVKRMSRARAAVNSKMRRNFSMGWPQKAWARIRAPNWGAGAGQRRASGVFSTPTEVALAHHCSRCFSATFTCYPTESICGTLLSTRPHAHFLHLPFVPNILYAVALPLGYQIVRCDTKISNSAPQSNSNTLHVQPYRDIGDRTHAHGG